MAEDAKIMKPEYQQGVEEIRKTLPRRVKWICWFVKQGSYFTRRSDGTVNRGLASWFLHSVPANETPDRGVYSRDAVIDPLTGVWVRLFIPVLEDDKSEKLPVVVYFHGGGFCMLSAAQENYDLFCRRLAKRRRVVVVSVEYRLAPEHKFPVAYEDCYAALLWLRNDHGESSFLPRCADVSRCFLMGESAGGNIVHHVGCRVAEGKEDLTPLKILGHVLIQPFFGGEERTPSELALTDVPLISVDACDWSWKAFLPEGANRDHPAANVVGYGGAEISAVQLPKSLVVIGGLDTLRDWQLRYFDYLKKMKKEVELLFYENGVHGFPLMPYDLSSSFLDDISDFMQR
ncbi:hypothetical protein SUGI_0889180 [Cryptomeria japonica]|uniref:probable carboxylesterase 18 n=1 Tax=Cryptomeria japonica TaxID=3369 RepID=UPI002414BF4D|nr:probable carboxylesterase 18 [Cryptomeria japonica]GLJ42901.1 hypothetical protein SUGI_0889180 [Cryptomeria japonica]